ncbi:phosphotransferase [Legionella sp. D16C41]|uniref:phosphotransferase n=1 Tax=Legionella sp. D16C41 TaxID=3402688 RepID=UPI003AF4DDCC
MRRNELKYSDQQLIVLIEQGYHIKGVQLHFIDTGSFYSFIIQTEKNKKFFLKIYPKNQPLVPIPPTTNTLHNMAMTLYRFRHEFGLKHVPCIIKTIKDTFCFDTYELTLILCNYIVGSHPSYLPNELLFDKLASLLAKLHQLPTAEFTYFAQEDFDISYGLGLLNYFKQKSLFKDNIHTASLFSQLKIYQNQLIEKLEQLKTWQKQLQQKNIPLAITHGDPHHYNILQTQKEVWLVDWDGIKIAPIERDLWHYQDTNLLTSYSTLNPNSTIDLTLCKFYQLQRFFEDIRYYLEQILLKRNSTRAQDELDKEAFLNHWGWQCCL